MSHEYDCYSLNGDDWEEGDRQAAVFDLIERAEGHVAPGVPLYLGIRRHYTNDEFFRARSVIEDAADRAYDVAHEFADDYPDVSEAAKVELETLLTAWFEKHVSPPGFWTVEHVTKVELTAEDIAGYRELL